MQIKTNIEIYVDANNGIPFVDWLENLKDQRGRYRIKERLDRVALGNLGHYKSVGDGVYELKMAFGPGYRVYYGKDGNNLILLLCGGDKSTQSKDIKKAKAYWRDYLLR